MNEEEAKAKAYELLHQEMFEAGVPFYERLKLLKEDYGKLDFWNDENRHAVWYLGEELAKAKEREAKLREALEGCECTIPPSYQQDWWTQEKIDELLGESGIKTGLEPEVSTEQKLAHEAARAMLLAEKYNRDTDELCKRLERENRELYNALEKLDPNNQALEFEANDG